MTETKPAAPARKRSLGKTIVFSLLPLLGFAISLELGCRLFPRSQVTTGTAKFLIPDDDLLWRMQPDHTGPYATNALGLRDNPPMADADRRILLLGDSVGWGDGIEDIAEIFPTRLEQALNSSSTQAVDLINACVPGWSTFQEAVYLRRDGWALNPDTVVLQFCLNDVFERYYSLFQYGGDSHFLGIDTRGVARSDGMANLIRYSRAAEFLVRYLQNRGRRIEEYHARNLAQPNLSQELEDAWEITLTELEDVRSQCAARNIPFLMIIVPYAFQLDDPENLRQPQDRVLAYCRAKGVQCIDLLPTLAALKRHHPTPLFRDSNHLSPRGHAAVATVLARVLTQNVRVEEQAAPEGQ